MDNIMNLLTTLLIILIFAIVILLFVAWYMSYKNKQNSEEEKTQGTGPTGGKTKVAKEYTKKSIFQFMQFDKIEDNMIIQDDSKKYLMVVECEGINYDLMSQVEKTAVEAGFVQFLNTLRYPIQIYVQTRTVNLTSSINTYKDRMSEISKQYANKQMEYNQKLKSGQYSERDLEMEKFEIARQRNLYEYGVDIVSNTEKMSLNRNILSKHYYIIIPYYPEDLANSDFDKEEISGLAFSELYTKAQAIISSLSVCGINSKVLDSMELAELLYVAYSRDESEIFNLRKALNAGFEDLYSTAPDVLDKRMKESDLKAEEEAIIKANEVVINVMEENEKQRRAKRKEAELDRLIDQMAMALIEENKRAIGEDVAQQAIEKIENEEKTKEEGGEEDVKETKAKTKARRRATV